MKQKKNRGITLIALVITIIIMLILVAVTVSYSVKSGLLDKTKFAKEEWRYNQASEEEYMSGEVEINGNTYYSIDDYVSGKEPKPTYPRIAKICVSYRGTLVEKNFLNDISYDGAFGFFISEKKPKISFDENNIFLDGLEGVPFPIENKTDGIDRLNILISDISNYNIFLVNSKNQIISHIDSTLPEDNYTAILIDKDKTDETLEILKAGDYYYGGEEWVALNTNRIDNITIYDAIKMDENFNNSKLEIGKLDLECFKQAKTVYRNWDPKNYENRGLYYDGKEVYQHSGIDECIYPIWYNQTFIYSAYEIASETREKNYIKNSDFYDRPCGGVCNIYDGEELLSLPNTIGWPIEGFPIIPEDSPSDLDGWQEIVENFLKQKNYRYYSEGYMIFIDKNPGPKLTVK